MFLLIRKVFNHFKGYLSPKNGVRNPQALLPTSSSKYSNFQLRLDNPVKDKIYVRSGKECVIGGSIIFESKEGEVSFGDRVSFGASRIICRSKVEFGSDIYVAWGTTFYDHDSHSLDYTSRLEDFRREYEALEKNLKNRVLTKDWNVVKTKPIKVCDYAWIGMNALILKGVTIGEGAVVGAGSVVTRDVAPWTVVGGNPAKIIKAIPNYMRK